MSEVKRNPLGQFIKGGGTYNGMVKLTKKQVEEIKELYSQGYLQREIAKRFNVTQMTISNVVNDKTKRYE